MSSSSSILEQYIPIFSKLLRAQERECVQHLSSLNPLPWELCQRAQERTHHLINALKSPTRQNRPGLAEAFLVEYSLSTPEGTLLLTLAEALLRIPDTHTKDAFILSKITRGDWARHVGRSFSFIVNATTTSLRLLHFAMNTPWSRALVMPMARFVSHRAILLMARQFVMGSTIERALERTSHDETYYYSYDMLGEAARTAKDARRYFQSYKRAIASLGARAGHVGTTLLLEDMLLRPGISIKLSALHPRYEAMKRERILEELTPRILDIAQDARKNNLTLAIDAEEYGHLELMLELFERVRSSPLLKGFDGLGVVVQAYQKRALAVIDFLVDVSKKYDCYIPVRLVKGAYWDTEIKISQERGLKDYPNYTLKSHTDASYFACAHKLIQARPRLYPQFATHDAYTLNTICEMIKESGDTTGFEFQKLHGMGDQLYRHALENKEFEMRCRVYAPVGVYEDLLPYLVRRILENGANSSFAHQVYASHNSDAQRLLRNPFLHMSGEGRRGRNETIPLPEDIFGPKRKNARGLELDDFQTLSNLETDIAHFFKQEDIWNAHPIVGGVEYKENQEKMREVYAPFDSLRVMGHCLDADERNIEDALRLAVSAQPSWDLDVAQRVRVLNQAADALEESMHFFIALIAREGGRCLMDCVSEVREAVDFLRYYAVCAEEKMSAPMPLPAPSGERNTLELHGRGVFVCISPWNFPLAIFMGQVAAALASGNAVLAKPAEQTPIVAAHAVRLLHKAGVPTQVLHLLTGDGERVGASLVAREEIAGVVFTGSLAAARSINQSLAQRQGAIIPLIAETGGQNAMIVDSTVLLEQVCVDVIASSFQSAGQRCSALRVLYIQEEIADKLIDMLKEALQELEIGDPYKPSTDVGPVIDKDAVERLKGHQKAMREYAHSMAEAPLREALVARGHFFAPCLMEIPSIKLLKSEVFGPILHIIRYASRDLGKIIQEINETGFGLTFGVESRIEDRIQDVVRDVNAGNIYVNRSIIGAVVGSQPFGGEGLSGTGPKAGGPHYLLRFVKEKTVSNNLTAIGGNPELLEKSSQGEI